ncbi:MAG TPA: dihydrodipicolinate synthase family protein [Terriglobia bacterium]|nr:dihydrodipicolinate synthase family protein [Terriglobia bacterium]
MTAKEKYPLRGVVVSLNTPFDEHDRVDFSSIERCVDLHLREGAVGFIVGAQASEVFTLKTPERLEILRHVRAVTQGKAELFASATSRDPRERNHVAEEANRLNCDGVLIEVPEELKGDEPKILRFFTEFARIGMKILMIQDLSWRDAGMPVSLIAELFQQVQPFRCLKVETVPACPKYTAVLASTQGRLHVSGGWASLQLLEALDRGVDAIVPTGMTGLFTRIFEAYARGEREQARDIYHKLLPVLAFTQQHLDISIQFYKRFFCHRGIFMTTKARAPQILYDSAHERLATELIEYLDRLDAWGPSP